MLRNMHPSMQLSGNKFNKVHFGIRFGHGCFNISNSKQIIHRNIEFPSNGNDYSQIGSNNSIFKLSNLPMALPNTFSELRLCHIVLCTKLTYTLLDHAPNLPFSCTHVKINMN